MTFGEALDIVVSRTGHERFRWLCSDANPDRESASNYRRTILEMAGGASPVTPARPAVTEVLAGLRLAKTCAYRSTEGCGCSGARCAIRGANVSHQTCLECVRIYPI